MGFSLDFRGVHRLPRSTGGGERGALERQRRQRERGEHSDGQSRPLSHGLLVPFSERCAGGDPALRIVISEDGTLFREGLARLLEDAGHEVVAKTVDTPSLIAAVDTTLADLAIVDIRMPPGIARRLWLTERTVETHVASILSKLGLGADEEDHRRVLAVLTFLNHRRTPVA